MATAAKLDVKDQDLLAALREFFKSVLAQDDIRAILVPCQLPMKNMVMPTLVTDPAPRLQASRPTTPEPANRSRKRAPTVRAARIENNASRTRSVVGRVFSPLGGSSDLPLKRPATIRISVVLPAPFFPRKPKTLPF